MFLFTGCVPSVEKQLEKAKELVKDKDYKEAIEIYEAILDENETEFEAWDGLVNAYMKDDEYEDADETLEEFFEAVKDDYEEDDEVDYDDWLEEINDYAMDILDEDEEVGDWFDELNPPMIDLSMVDYDQSIDEPIVLDIPKGLDVYYTLDGSDPSDKDDKYKDGIEITEEGSYDLAVVAINEFGIEGYVNYIYINVYKMPDAPIVTTEPGTYNEEIILFVDNYDYDTMELYYTTDGTDPESYGMYYYEEDGIRLTSGDYQVRMYYYDYNSGTYSEEASFDYTINNPNAVSDSTDFNVAVFGVDDNTFYEVEYAINEIYYYEENMNVYPYQVTDLDSLMLDLESGYADAYYGPAMYVEDLAAYGLLADVENVISFDDYTYYNVAYDAGFYDGGYYTMPVTIDADNQLYVNIYDVADMNIDSWDSLINAANNGYSSYNFLYPEDMGGYWLYSFYLGFGGYYDFDTNGMFVLDRQPLIDALTFAYDLPVTYQLGYEGMDFETYTTAISNNNVTMVIANPYYMSEYDYYDYYTPVGPMPLPNGEYFASVNNVNGLHINSQVTSDINKSAVARTVYKYIAQEYSVNYIAQYADGLPAITTAVDTDYLYLNGDLEDYEFAIDYNITAPYTYQLQTLHESMDYYLYEVLFNGMDIGLAADAIIDEAANYTETY